MLTEKDSKRFSDEVPQAPDGVPQWAFDMAWRELHPTLESAATSKAQESLQRQSVVEYKAEYRREPFGYNNSRNNLILRMFGRIFGNGIVGQESITPDTAAYREARHSPIRQRDVKYNCHATTAFERSFLW